MTESSTSIPGNDSGHSKTTAKFTQKKKTTHKMWRPGVIGTTLVCGILIGFRHAFWPPVFEGFARSALSQHDDRRALQWLDWATAMTSETGETAFLRARTFRHLGEMDKCVQALMRAQKLGIPAQRLQRESWLGQAQTGQLREVESFLPNLLIDPQGDTEEICEAYVLGYLRTQRSVQAFEILKSWINDLPHQARPYLLRARFWELKSNFGKALEDLERAVQLEPQNPDANFELASVLQQSNQCDRAKLYFEKSLKFPEFSSRAHVGLALCLKTLGVLDRVRMLLEAAIRISSSNARAHAELGRLDFEAENYAAAIQHLNEAVGLAPHDEEIHFLLGQTLNSAGKPDEAAPHFEFIRRFHEGLKELTRLEDRLNTNPRDVEALVQAGAILMDVADPEEGVLRLLTAIEINPMHVEARRLLAEHYMRRAKTQPEFRPLAEQFRKTPE